MEVRPVLHLWEDAFSKWRFSAPVGNVAIWQSRTALSILILRNKGIARGIPLCQMSD
jgi:hypothetical protein